MAADPEPAPRAASDPGGLRALREGVRTALWWVGGAFAAVALLLLPGLRIADVSALDGWRRLVAIAAAAIGIATATLAFWLVARFVRLGNLSLDELTDEQRSRHPEIVAYLNRNSTLFAGEADSLDDLQRRYEQALAAVVEANGEERIAAAALRAHDAATPPPAGAPRDDEPTQRAHTQAAQRLESARARVTIIEQAIASVESVARLQELRGGFMAARLQLAACTLVVTLAMLGFAYAAHPPARAVGDLSGQRIEHADLSGAELRQVDLHDATLEHVNLTGANLDGADLDGARWIDTTCPDGKKSEASGDTCVTRTALIPEPIDPTVGALPQRHDGTG